MTEIEQLGPRSGGEIVRIGLGVARPFLLTHPDHVQHVLRENSAYYVRDGVFWSPLRRLFGDSVLSEGETWRHSRRVLQPVFTTRHVASVTAQMADVIGDAVAALDGAAAAGRPVDALTEMGNIVNRTVLKVFFGDKISAAELDVLAPAFESVATSLAFRFLLPFVPDAIRLPGDRSFRTAVEAIDGVMFALARRYREQPAEDRDIFSVLCRAWEADGGEITERWVRDNLVAIFATATETTAGALTWLWPLLDTYPDVDARLQEEIDRVVGAGPVRAEHVPGLVYTRQVIQEVLRLYPVGWLFPRMAVRAETLDGVEIKAGDSVLISPFLTHRLAEVWTDPLVFDPGRFTPEASAGRHRYAYFPFGGGPHQCIGMHVFNVESQLIVAAVLSRFRPVLRNPVPAMPKVGASLRPRESVELTLVPRRAGAAKAGS